MPSRGGLDPGRVPGPFFPSGGFGRGRNDGKRAWLACNSPPGWPGEEGFLCIQRCWRGRLDKAARNRSKYTGYCAEISFSTRAMSNPSPCPGRQRLPSTAPLLVGLMTCSRTYVFRRRLLSLPWSSSRGPRLSSGAAPTKPGPAGFRTALSPSSGLAGPLMA
ncbi:hypothetical protein GQ53DRAFT_132766 [Thozetella sp. PMI_491]|nr:hypothetical protein GQ53DRAFT_132766 [Thozetella sp. PMI_491]